MNSKILQGDALEVLKTLESESVDCVVTSPPYWALRDYGVAGQLGLEPTFMEYIQNLCNIFDEVKRVLKLTGTCWVNIGDTYFGGGWDLGASPLDSPRRWGDVSQVLSRKTLRNSDSLSPSGTSSLREKRLEKKIKKITALAEKIIEIVSEE